MAILDLRRRKVLRGSRFMRCSTGATSRRARPLPFVEQLEAKLKQIGTRANRDGDRALLRDGSRHALGADRQAWRASRRGWRGRGVERARRASGEIVRGREKRRVRDPACDRRARADGRWRPGDLLHNFRADRARQLTAAIALDGFSGFKRSRIPKSATYGMTEYDRSFGLPLAFGPGGHTRYARGSAGACEAPQSARSLRRRSMRT